MKELICGLPASGGVFKGRVKIIKTLSENAKIQEGEILVTRNTTPEWMHLLLKAGAVIASEGGLLSHPAIVCRELSKPAIVGAGEEIFNILSDGMEVIVDGNVGKVFVDDIERMKEALARSAYDSGKMQFSEIWPIHPMETYPYFIDFFLEELNKKIDFIKKNDVKVSPSRIWFWLINSILGYKAIDADKKKSIELTKKLLDLLKDSMHGNPFCEDYTHRILPEVSWEKTTINKKKNEEILKLNANLMCYCQTLYWVTNCAFREIHGPYEIIFEGKPAQVIVREYFNVNPFGKRLPYDYIRTETVYDKDINFKFFVLNDFLWDKQIGNHILDSKCFFDGKEVTDVKKISELNDLIVKNNKEESFRVNSLKRAEKITGLARRFFKTLEEFGEVTFPEDKIVERIKNVKINIQNREMDREAVKELFDPRK